MTPSPEDPDESLVLLPGLLRLANRTYARAVRAALDAGGCGDLPPNGPFVLGAVSGTSTPLAEITGSLGLSKQRSSALVDELVGRGYVTREPDPDDRRRMRIGLTDRGEAAVALTRAAVERLDAWLLAEVGADNIATARRVLWRLTAHEAATERAEESDDD